MSSMFFSMFFEHSFPLIIMPDTLKDFTSSFSISKGSIDIPICSGYNNLFYPAFNQSFSITYMTNSLMFSSFYHNLNYYFHINKYYLFIKTMDQFFAGQTLHKHIVEGKGND